MKQKKIKFNINRLNISLIVTVVFVIALIISSQWLVKQKTSYQPHAETTGTRYLNPIFPELNITNNILYRQIEGTQLFLDLYQPKNDLISSRPAIIWIHSGGFYSGKKEDISGLATEFAKRGYVTAAIDYRLSEGIQLTKPEQIGNSPAIIKAQSDGEAAIQWMKDNAAKYRVNPNLVFIGGGSAGAVTAILVGYNSKTQIKVAGVVAIMGVADPAMVKSGGPPVIMLNGGIDQIIPYVLVKLFQNQIIDKQIPHQFEFYPNATHGQIPFTDQVLKISQFLAKIVTGQPLTNNSSSPITNAPSNSTVLAYFKKNSGLACSVMKKYLTSNNIKLENFYKKNFDELAVKFPTIANQTNATPETVKQAYLSVCPQ